MAARSRARSRSTAVIEAASVSSRRSQNIRRARHPRQQSGSVSVVGEARADARCAGSAGENDGSRALRGRDGPFKAGHHPALRARRRVRSRERDREARGLGRAAGGPDAAGKNSPPSCSTPWSPRPGSRSTTRKRSTGARPPRSPVRILATRGTSFGRGSWAVDPVLGRRITRARGGLPPSRTSARRPRASLPRRHRRRARAHRDDAPIVPSPSPAACPLGQGRKISVPRRVPRHRRRCPRPCRGPRTAPSRILAAQTPRGVIPAVAHAGPPPFTSRSHELPHFMERGGTS
jgi:hypothetical protein